MYSFYMPKVRWAKGDSNGHRHYWASIVVWLQRWGCEADDATAVWPVGVSFTSDHLKWDTANAGDISFKSSTVGVDMPTHPRMQINDNAIAPFGEGDLEKLFERTLVSWHSLPNNVQQALADVKYEKTEVPFINANFQRQINAAYRESFYGGLQNGQGCNDDDAPLPSSPETPKSEPSSSSAKPKGTGKTET